MLIFKETFVFEIELTHLFLKVTGFFLNKTDNFFGQMLKYKCFVLF